MRRASEKLGDFSHPLVDVTGLTHWSGHTCGVSSHLIIWYISFNSVIASLPSRMETVVLKIWFHTNHQSFQRDQHELSRYQVSISSGCSISTIPYRSTVSAVQVKWNYCRWWLGMMCINLLSPCLYVERFEPWDCSGDGCVIWKIYCNLLLQWKVLHGSNGHL